MQTGYWTNFLLFFRDVNDVYSCFDWEIGIELWIIFNGNVVCSCQRLCRFMLYCLSCQLAVKNLSKHFEFFMHFLIFAISISTIFKSPKKLSKHPKILTINIDYHLSTKTSSSLRMQQLLSSVIMCLSKWSMKQLIASFNIHHTNEY